MAHNVDFIFNNIYELINIALFCDSLLCILSGSLLIFVALHKLGTAIQSIHQHGHTVPCLLPSHVSHITEAEILDIMQPELYILI